MTTHSLSAWIGEQPVGTLSYHDDTGRFSFEYEQTWMTHSGAYPISPALPFQRPDDQTDELHLVNVRRFFENLLSATSAFLKGFTAGCSLGSSRSSVLSGCSLEMTLGQRYFPIGISFFTSNPSLLV